MNKRSAGTEKVCNTTKHSGPHSENHVCHRTVSPSATAPAAHAPPPLRTVSPWATAPAAHAAPPPPSPLHTRVTRLYSHPPRDTPDAGRAVVSQREFRVYSSPTTTLRLVLGREAATRHYSTIHKVRGGPRTPHTHHASLPTTASLATSAGLECRLGCGQALSTPRCRQRG